MNRPLFLLTNDDGIHAPGLQALVEALSPLGELLVMAPDSPRSSLSCAITLGRPITYHKAYKKPGVTAYHCSGTPADCVKLALVELKIQPNWVISGINHGSNSATSSLYSATVGAAIQGCVEGIPSVAFSLCDTNPQADMQAAVQMVQRLMRRLLRYSMPEFVYLNINIPAVPSFRGVRVCRQCRGRWHEQFTHTKNTSGHLEYWLTGYFENIEPDLTGTDEEALSQGYVTVVPSTIDLTAYQVLPELYFLTQDGETE